jgi:hypothetical protein
MDYVKKAKDAGGEVLIGGTGGDISRRFLPRSEVKSLQVTTPKDILFSPQLS